ncbi:Glucose/arabinose dehydrogenase, beta-propeller fold [Pedobacter westerhofensis]|uniref:Glucose/arabinose dehydrogenase, beta-propeller fold n=1 Tax=Pedobacter westerhofensis TaxID=425512 RepID=A0A521ATS6_9SPHI|nr:PQQ-dependent sugar dehydrogenase [Pedobacter westerhofensis]SMO38268.1 Glucose/arabinose dehydrogenase, beta-propeller fold [Pedobacter westerhofensis]
MKKYILPIVAGSILLASSCSKSNDDNETTQPPETTTPGTSVETQPPNSTYRPAFAGQTRIAAVRSTTAFSSTVLSTALTSPWSIAALPDGRFLITEKAGNMRLVTASGQVGNPLTGIPAVNSAGQGGLLGLCADPAFATNRMVYWSYSERVADGNVLAVAKGRLSATETGMENVTVIYRATPAYSGTNQYGSRVIFDRTGNLLVSSGDRSDPGIRVQAQALNSAIGKIVRITTDGQPAAGNPFTGQAGARPELYSIGHRNEHGLAIHPVTGDLWEGELGPRGGDEINLIRPGANYGWPVITYGIDYSGQPIGNAIQQQTGMEQPVYYWDPVVSPSGMTFYKGSRIPEWENNLFVAALSGMHIVRLVITNNRVTGEERLLVAEQQRFRDITQGVDNALYAITDAGRLYRIDRQ